MSTGQNLFHMKSKIVLPQILFERGHGRPRIGLVACLHGDEPIGHRAIMTFAAAALLQGSIRAVLAHPRAVAKAKRFFDSDLNRSFAQPKGSSEEGRVARAVLHALAGCDSVIDIHGTNSRIDALAIVTRWNEKTKAILASLPVRNVMYAQSRVFAKGALISHVPTGVSLEYGPTKSDRRYGVAARHITQVLINKGVLPGAKKFYRKKIVYTIIGTYKVPEPFSPSSKLKEFTRIRKGDYIGHVRGKKFYATKSFYPIFLGKGRYKGSLALMATRRTVTL